MQAQFRCFQYLLVPWHPIPPDTPPGHVEATCLCRPGDKRINDRNVLTNKSLELVTTDQSQVLNLTSSSSLDKMKCLLIENWFNQIKSPLLYQALPVIMDHQQLQNTWDNFWRCPDLIWVALWHSLSPDLGARASCLEHPINILYYQHLPSFFYPIYVHPWISSKLEIALCIKNVETKR